ncbi:hypothetical protein PRIPAC_98056, partial [Pristionchus pacificus]|uniref:Uncharacterized protein n=1 Tax=Pristionchus pacificus TaxID=54126 RepID=A0A2A6BD84_PRIPA
CSLEWSLFGIALKEFDGFEITVLMITTGDRTEHYLYIEHALSLSLPGLNVVLIYSASNALTVARKIFNRDEMMILREMKEDQ